MKRILTIYMLLILFQLLSGPAIFSAEYQKLAQTGLKFLSVPLDARASALSGAFTAIEDKSISLMFNPANMAQMPSRADFALGQVKWIGDINYVFATAAFSPLRGQFGVIGFSLLSVDYGKMNNTILADNEQGFLELGEFNPTAYTVGLGYAKALSDRFSVGGQAKYVFQSLGSGVVGFNSQEFQYTESFEVDVMAFDFGVMYRTGFKSLNFGLSVRNFSKEITYIEESFQLPLTFEMGLCMNVLDLSTISSETHKLFLSVDASHPRDFGEQLDLGLEYTFMNMVALRAGYTSPTDEQGFCAGAGLQQTYKDFGLQVDYAYTDFGIFKEVHRFTFKFSF
jgi:hypothetical protein